MIKNLEGSDYGMVWLDIETNPSKGCSWDSYSGPENCQYIGELLHAVQAHGKKAGVYASRYMWTEILRDPNTCRDYANFPLWYPHYDKKESMADFIGFGGWTKPTIKQH